MKTGGKWWPQVIEDKVPKDRQSGVDQELYRTLSAGKVAL
jgi:hypothetical protein